jgi:glycosyltransferase involved in cell wall biosynthesis
MTNQTRPIAPITVAIAVKDREEDLARALFSLREQTIIPAEVIVIDDGSAVPVQEAMLRDALPTGTMAVLLRNDRSQGAARSYNRTVETARYEVVAFLDSDDAMMPLYIERVSAFWHQADTGMVGLATSFLWCLDSMRPYRRQPIVPEITTERLVRDGNYVGGSSVLSVQRTAFLAVGGFPVLPGSSDWAFLINLSRHGRICTIDEPLVWYRAPGITKAVTDTGKYMVQARAVSRLRQSLPPAERHLARRVLLETIAFNAAQAGKRRLSRRALFMMRQEGYSANGVMMRTMLINVIGSRGYRLMLDVMARWRARQFTA